MSHVKLEAEIADWMGYTSEQVVSCSSGTAALHLALEAMEVKGEVIVPDFTMVACPRAVTLAGCTPVFVDCGSDLLMDYDFIHEAMDRGKYNEYNPGSVGALMAVHIYGRRQSMEDIYDLLEGATKNVAVIEDMAELHGVKPHVLTDAACWSFYKNKIVHGEEGGAVAFRNCAHAKRARSLRSLGFTDAHDFNHIPRGHNYRMSDCHAELIRKSLAQFRRGEGLTKLTGFRPEASTLVFPNGERASNVLAMRRRIESWYENECPDEWRMPPRDVPWIYDVRLTGVCLSDNGPVTNMDVVRELNRQGIAARRGFQPMHCQPEYKGCKVVYDTRKSVKCYDEAKRIIYLPIQPGVTTREDCHRAFQVLTTFLRGS